MVTVVGYSVSYELCAMQHALCTPSDPLFKTTARLPLSCEGRCCGAEASTLVHHSATDA
jgi:hypothetical protein